MLPCEAFSARLPYKFNRRFQSLLSLFMDAPIDSGKTSSSGWIAAYNVFPYFRHSKMISTFLAIAMYCTNFVQILFK